MDELQIDQLLNTLLYEGYALYPYRPSLKNIQRWTFGTLFPRSVCETLQTGDSWRMQTEFLVRTSLTANLRVEIRFLQPISNATKTWQSSLERRLEIPLCTIERLQREPIQHAFEFAIGGCAKDAALVVQVELSALIVGEDVYRLTTSVANTTPVTSGVLSREAASQFCLASTQMVFRIQPGSFFSLTDPPAEWTTASAECLNENCWPVLLGRKKSASALLACPLILDDDPQVSIASHGDLFDATEIDEVLSLRIRTLTPVEKEQMTHLDDRTRGLLERTEALLDAEMQQLHAAALELPLSFSANNSLPSFPPCTQKPTSVQLAGQSLRVGDLVRLRPRRQADIFDLVLRGQVAQIAAIEQDFEDRIYLAVCVVDDPGVDIGLAGKIGHRFYFQPDEVEPLSECES